ncbi:MAG TPA: O-antigen ligase family protein [Usitatibacter sp.]|nr:O-antigen ligase family protein [Usitatibacter sp.]
MNARVAVLAVLVAAVIVWQVSHMIWLRYTLLIVLGVLCWPAAVRTLARPAAPLQQRARVPFALFGAFLLWSIAVALFVSSNTALSLKELRAEWLAPALVLLLGFGLGIRYGERHGAVRAIFLAFMLHAFMQLAAGAVIVARGAEINWFNFGGISDHKANVTYTNALALAMLVADTVSRARRGAGFLGIDSRWAVAAFALLLVSTVLATTRNGLIVFGLLMLAGFVLIALQMRAETSRRAWVALVACGAAAIAGALAGLKADPRWSTFRATAPVAWDTERHREWLLGERNESILPVTASGKKVDPSAYYRIAYLREGLRLVVEHPLGTGLGRDAFRRTIHEKFGTAGMSHAHNGFVDLAVSVGIPGVALWLAFLAALVAMAARAGGMAAGSGLALAMVLVVAAFLARTMLDATMRDLVLGEFLLLAGLLCGAIAYGDRRAAS